MILTSIPDVIVSSASPINKVDRPGQHCEIMMDRLISGKTCAPDSSDFGFFDVRFNSQVYGHESMRERSSQLKLRVEKR